MFRICLSRLATPTRLRSAALLLGFSVVLITADRAAAEPRYTARYGQNCVLCHVNPTGGGMRSLYASQYLVPNELARESGPVEGLVNTNPELTPGITVGADLRTLIFLREGGSGTVFSMQGDIYLHAQLSSAVAVYLEQGQSRSGETFGTARILPWDGYLKAGRFIPDHGWRFADHQMFNQRYLYGPAGSEDPGVLYASGLEVGVSPGMFSATASLLGSSPGDPDQRLGDDYAAKAMIHRSIGELNLGLGGSVLRRSGVAEHLRSAGVFWYAGIGPVTWLGQVDETRQLGKRGLLVAQEATITLARGTDLFLTYGFQDPDADLTSGARHRKGAGLAVMPASYFSTQLTVNRWQVDGGEAVAGQDYLETDLVIHFLF